MIFFPNLWLKNPPKITKKYKNQHGKNIYEGFSFYYKNVSADTTQKLDCNWSSRRCKMYFISYDQTYTAHAWESDLKKNNWLPSECFLICIDMKNSTLKATENQVSHSIRKLTKNPLTLEKMLHGQQNKMCYLGIPPFKGQNNWTVDTNYKVASNRKDFHSLDSVYTWAALSILRRSR